MSNLVVVVSPEHTTYVRTDFQSADQSATYQLVPGEYPIKFVNIQYVEVDPDESPYYAIAEIPAVQTSFSYTNRLGSASRRGHDKMERPTTVDVNIYSYEAKPGRTVLCGAAVIEGRE